MSNLAPRKHDVPSVRFRSVAAGRIAGIRVDGKSPVLREELFSYLLVTERKRSDRSGRPFVLLSVRAKDRLDFESSATGKAAIEAMVALTRETDVLGWVEFPRVIGVIFSEIGAADPVGAAETIRARVFRELGQRLGAGAATDFSLDFRVYPESRRSDTKSDPGHVDPVFHPDLAHHDKKRRFSEWIKRAIDVFASGTLLLSLAPLLLVVAAVVRLTSPGPVLFKQVRMGKMGKPFRMFKFRTMYIDAAENPHQEFISHFIKESGRVQTSAGDHVVCKLTNDPRITPAGRILRKTSIDELPQLWNVLIGEMSLVGPRPPLPYEVSEYAPWHRRRLLEAKPGITGLWQVTGRSRTTFDQMVRLDLRYARTRSIWADLRILLRTPGAVVGGKGAR